MEYSLSEIAEIRAKAHASLNSELDRAIRNHTIEEFMDKYCIVYEEEWVPIEKNRSRILVFGDLAGKKNVFQGVAKSIGIPKDNIEFINDFKELKRINVTKLRNSSNYSDIIYGPTPHSQVGMGDVSSLLADMRNNPSVYPRIIEATANNQLKISKTEFEKAIRKTRYYEKIILEG